MKRILLIVFLLFSFKVFALPSNTMSITPVAVASATIEADDENTRNNAISTTYNAHSHDDISSATTNDFTIGDGQTSNKSFSVNNADANNPALRYNDSSDVWEASNDGVTFTEIITDAGTQSLAGTKTFSNVDINGGTMDGVNIGTTTATGELIVNNSSDDADGLGSQGTSGQVLTSGGVGVNPTWSVEVPSGVIVMWSGAISAIPSGWVICDGNNSTPNLTDRFVIHADADSGGTNDVGDTGGAHTHSLTEGELATHSHGITIASGGGTGTINQGGGTLTTINTGTTGSGTAHENRPKFYALAYIMKT